MRRRAKVVMMETVKKVEENKVEEKEIIYVSGIEEELKEGGREQEK